MADTGAVSFSTADYDLRMSRLAQDSQGIDALIPILETKLQTIGRKGETVVAGIVGSTAHPYQVAYQAVTAGRFEGELKARIPTGKVLRENERSVLVAADCLPNFLFDDKRGDKLRITSSAAGEFNIGVGGLLLQMILISDVQMDPARIDKLSELFRTQYCQALALLARVVQLEQDVLDLRLHPGDSNEVLSVYFSLKRMFGYFAEHPRLLSKDEGGALHALCNEILQRKNTFTVSLSQLVACTDEELMRAITNYIVRRMVRQVLPKSQWKVISGMESFPPHVFTEVRKLGERDGVVNLESFLKIYEKELAASPKGSGACFIATAVFGDGNAPEVVLLRRWRDERLLRAPLGEEIVQVYYRYSPTIAAFIQDRSILRNACRYLILKPMIWFLTAKRWRSP